MSLKNMLYRSRFICGSRVRRNGVLKQGLSEVDSHQDGVYRSEPSESIRWEEFSTIVKSTKFGGIEFDKVRTRAE